MGTEPLFNLTGISAIIFATTLINARVAWISWRRQKTISGRYFSYAMIAVTGWTLASAFDYAAVPLSLSVFFAKLEYIFYNLALVLFVLFALAFGGYSIWLKRKWFTSTLWILAAICAITALTNDWHHLLWSGFTASKVWENVFVFERGPAYLPIAIIDYSFVLIFLGVIWQTTRQAGEITRRQGRMLLGAGIFPIASNTLYQLALPQFQGIDWTSVTFSISGIMFLLALYDSRLLDLTSISRHRIIEWMPDAMLILDSENRLVDYNLTIQTLFGVQKKHLGQPADTFLSGWPQIMEIITMPEGSPAPVEVVLDQMLRFMFDIQMHLMQDDLGQVFNKVLIFRNVTSRVKTESALQQQLAEIRELNQKLHESQDRVIEQQRSMAIMEERERLGRDLHDSVNQSIHSLILFTDTLKGLLESDQADQARHVIDRIQASATQALKETRLLLYEIESSKDKESADIVERLKERLRMVETSVGIHSRITVEGDTSAIRQEWQENLFWICIEALNNALKHAQANEVAVEINCNQNNVEVRIADNGIGFDKSKQDRGIGSRTMQERAKLLGGKLEIQSTPGLGTIVNFQIKNKVIPTQN